MLDLKKLVSKLFSYAEIEKIEVYNEFSFQHELGIFLRKELDSYIIQFERNVSYFSIGSKTIKKEIDISIFNNDKTEKYAIELKHPLNGQYPEQMYSFVKDIKFMEELKENGFAKNAVVILVSDRPFYADQRNNGIYKYFRDEYRVYGDIFKPTGAMKGKEFIPIKGDYNFTWQSLNREKKYFIVEI
ncbi:hypothetical protein EQM13_01280 [Acidilutibacter cellobiosedens]|uniref:Uncharacterized protein n=1 Tax=Acidilutibacter cellobiosedens TaxID=2507161 RepID=A0A410Q8N5_9FIRM|nr:hypothetical protein [Acidilutibacter cellobiosedens]QAT60298.1 hypothetical protein EQM13_01280 [Acidilutibacter cellobiosedens]